MKGGGGGGVRGEREGERWRWEEEEVREYKEVKGDLGGEDTRGSERRGTRGSKKRRHAGWKDPVGDAGRGETARDGKVVEKDTRNKKIRTRRGRTEGGRRKRRNKRRGSTEGSSRRAESKTWQNEEKTSHEGRAPGEEGPKTRRKRRKTESPGKDQEDAGGQAQTRRSNVESETSTQTSVLLEIRNIKGIRSSLEAITATLDRRESNKRPPLDLLIILESFSTQEAQIELEGYTRLEGVSATRTYEVGRRKGGVEVFVRKGCRVPMQVLRTGREPTNCTTVIVGGGKPKGNLAVVAYYLAPSSEAICDVFFEGLASHVAFLQQKGYATLAGGDANAHLGLPEGRPQYVNNPDYAGACWLDWAENASHTRISPVSRSPWTCYSMQASDYKNEPSLPPGKGRSIVDHVSADEAAQSAVTSCKLNTEDHYRTDHAGLQVTVLVEGPKTPPPSKQRNYQSTSRAQLRECDPLTGKYTDLVEDRLGRWNASTRRERALWIDASYVADRIRSLEDLLITTMNEVNPSRRRSAGESSKKARPQTRQLERQRLLQRLRDSVFEILQRGGNAEADFRTYQEAMKEAGSEMAASEGKERAAQAATDSADIEAKEAAPLWDRRKRLLASRRKGVPQRIFGPGGELLSGPEAVREVERAVSAMLTPSDEHLLAPPSASFDRTVEDRHRELLEATRNTRDWQPTDEDTEAVLEYFCRAYRNHTSPGIKGLTADMVVFGGPNLREALHLMLLMTAACASTPGHWGTILLLLSLKPGRPAQDVEHSYRPVSMGELMLKGFENALKAHYQEALIKRPLHPAIMAYRKGIGTDMALFTLIGATLVGKSQGKKLFILAIDIKCAFNGVWKQLLEVLEWEEHGIEGTLWSLVRSLSENTRYRVRLQNILSKIIEQKDGLAQGPLLSPDRYNVLSSFLLTLLDDSGAGVIVQERTILGACWSDDLNLLVEESRLQKVLDAVAKFTSRLRLRVAHKKLFLIPLFVRGLQWADSGTTITQKTTEVKTTKVTIGGHPLTVKRSAKLLGRIFGQKIHQHSNYAALAKKSTAPAVGMLAWLGAFQPTASLQFAEFLYKSLVETIITSKVTTCQLSPADYEHLRATQCKVGRRATWAGKRVSQYIILRELGWTPVDVAIMMAKIGLHNRLKLLEPREYASSVLRERMAAVAEGDTKGLCFEVKQLWTQLGRPDAWDAKISNNETKKNELKGAVKNLMQRRIDAWIRTNSRTNGDYSELCDHDHYSPAWHIGNGTKLQVGLMITARAGACILRGNKTPDKRLSLADTLCKLCDQLEPETETHLLITCPYYDAWRRPLLTELHKVWSPQQSSTFTRADADQKRLFLLGARIGYGDDDMHQRRQRDLLVKNFLQSVNDHRTEKGLPDLRDAYNTQTDFTIEEAISWEADLRQELREDGKQREGNQVPSTYIHTVHTHTYIFISPHSIPTSSSLTPYLNPVIEEGRQEDGKQTDSVASIQTGGKGNGYTRRQTGNHSH